jgi:hypothetical protein
MTATQQAITTEIRVAETRIKVFISYSRADKAFASELVLGLAACGFAPYIDRQDIAPGEDWEKRLAGLITEADSIVYIVSPDSLASENCALELQQAVALRKRILPVVWRPIDDALAAPELKRLNYIFFAGEGRTFATGLSELANALRTDIDWIREHTRLAELGSRWSARGRAADMLLRGADIDAANKWLADKPITAPPVTDDQADFIKASSDARIEAERRRKRAQAGLLTAVSGVAVVFAGLAALAGWQWYSTEQQRAAKEIARGEAQAAQAIAETERDKARSANLRLEADVWLRTAPSNTGYYVVDSGWYPVVGNYSGAIVRVTREGGGHATWLQTGFIIDGGLIHPRYAKEPLLVLYAEQPMLSARPLKWQPPQGTTPADTVPAMSDVDQKIFEQLQRDAAARRKEAELAAAAAGRPPAQESVPASAPAAVSVSTGVSRPPGVAPRSPDDTLASGDPKLVQRYELSGQPEPGPEVISVIFPALTPKDASARSPDVALTASERVWQTPAQLGGERPFQIWRLNAPPPFGWRAIAQGDIDCQAFGPLPAERTVAMLSIALPQQDGATEDGPAPNALALNISQLLSRDTAQSITYTHSTNKASGGSPVFDLETGKVFAVHVSSSPNLTGPRQGLRTGEGYSFRHLLDMARSSIDNPQLGPVCEQADAPASPSR